jgi:glutamyl-tRNA reductase
MNYYLIGVNHKTAPVAVRERLAVSESRLPEAIRQLSQHPGISEAIIFSTCNRVEMLARSPHGVPDLRSFIREYFQLDESVYQSHIYEYRDEAAVRPSVSPPASIPWSSESPRF